MSELDIVQCLRGQYLYPTTRSPSKSLIRHDNRASLAGSPDILSQTNYTMAGSPSQSPIRTNQSDVQFPMMPVYDIRMTKKPSLKSIMEYNVSYSPLDQQCRFGSPSAVFFEGPLNRQPTRPKCSVSPTDLYGNFFS